MKERFMKIALCDDGVFVFESILNKKKVSFTTEKCRLRQKALQWDKDMLYFL